MKKSLTVGLAFELAEEYKVSKNDPSDRYFEFDTKDIVLGIERAIQKAGYKTILLGSFEKIIKNITEVQKEVDIVFNTCEGLDGRNREAQMPMILEYFHIPFVGSDALTMSVTLDKVVTKKILEAEHIPTPEYFTTEKEVKTFPKGFTTNFPLIVKPRWEGSSKGISSSAKVKNFAELNKQILFIKEKYKQPALVEKFIQGREITVAVLGNDWKFINLPILEIEINGSSANDRVFDSRYVYTDDVHYACPAKISKKLTNTLINLAHQTFMAVGCKDLGRVDIRVDQNENPYVLEINPLPALSKQDTFGTMARTIGMTYEQLVAQVLQVSINRYSFR